MVRAILAGTKTQTRRKCKARTQDQSDIIAGAIMEDILDADIGYHEGEAWRRFPCPYGQPGDRLWVRENWQPYDRMSAWDDNNGILVADCEYALCFQAEPEDESVKWVTAPIGNRAWPTTGERWIPSIHMPRWASRITLEIVSVRVEQLNEISEADAIAEGISIDHLKCETGREGLAPVFETLWESINGLGSWDANPWVWVVEFRRVEEVNDQSPDAVEKLRLL